MFQTSMPFWVRPAEGGGSFLFNFRKLPEVPSNLAIIAVSGDIVVKAPYPE